MSRIGFLNSWPRAHPAEQHGPRFEKAQSIAEICKIGLQMLIGATIAALVLLRFGWGLWAWMSQGDGGNAFESAGRSALTTTAAGLAFSAGLELAYMLFTPGPDEAIDPVILGLASLVLLVISVDNVGLLQVIMVFFLVLSIGFLFTIKTLFIAHPPKRQSRSERANSRAVAPPMQKRTHD